MNDTNPSIAESSEKSSLDYKLVARQYCILHGKCNHSTHKCKDFKSMISKHRGKKNVKSYMNGKKEQNALIEKRNTEICQEQEKEED